MDLEDYLQQRTLELDAKVARADVEWHAASRVGDAARMRTADLQISKSEREKGELREVVAKEVEENRRRQQAVRDRAMGRDRVTAKAERVFTVRWSVEGPAASRADPTRRARPSTPNTGGPSSISSTVAAYGGRPGGTAGRR